MAKFAVVAGIGEIKTAKDDREYKTLSIEERRFVKADDGTIMSLPPKVTGFNVWKENNLTGKPDFLWDAELERRIPGTIVKKATEPYLIPDADGQPQARGTYSMFVMGDTDNVEEYAADVMIAFKRLEKNKQQPIFLLGSVDATEAASVTADDVIAMED